MLPEQKAYIYAWVDGVVAAGFRAGVYCSGIPARDDENVVTADDIRKGSGSRSIVYFVSDDACPPAPGCAFPKRVPNPTDRDSLRRIFGNSHNRREGTNLQQSVRQPITLMGIVIRLELIPPNTCTWTRDSKLTGSLAGKKQMIVRKFAQRPADSAQ